MGNIFDREYVVAVLETNKLLLLFLFLGQNITPPSQIGKVTNFQMPGSETYIKM